MQVNSVYKSDLTVPDSVTNNNQAKNNKIDCIFLDKNNNGIVDRGDFDIEFEFQIFNAMGFIGKAWDKAKNFINSLNCENTKPLEQKETLTYELKNPSQIKNLMLQAQKYITKMPTEEQNKYTNFIKNIAYDSNGEIDIEDVNTLKAFLALKKVVKHQGNIPTIDRPIHNEDSVLLGDYYKEFKTFKEIIDADYDLFIAVDNLYDTIYTNASNLNILKIIPRTKTEEANKIAFEMLDEEMKKYSIEDPKTTFSYFDFWAGVTLISDIDNEWNDWKAEVILTEGGYGNEKNYSPEAIVLLHELYHIKQTKPGEPNEDAQKEFGELRSKNYHKELGATIDMLVREDEIYKRLNNIEIDSTGNYDDIITPNGTAINTNEFINTMRQIKEQNKFETYEEVLTSPEGQKYLKEYFL